MRLGLLAAAAWLTTLNAVTGDDVNFNRDVRPILSEHCWRCHGFDEHARQADLRLDVREHALKEADSGAPAIVPGQPDNSELLARITSPGEDLRMPPADTGERLSPEQIQTLRLWIEQGAVYQQHWSFQPLEKPTVPRTNPGTHPIDAFVAARLQEQNLQPAPRASPETLLRRVALDLTGLPPALEDLDKLQTESWEQTVDRLLASPHFGERMAVDWLDLARYADTNGYFGDKPRQMWLWRDWVIDAFNRNLPFDRFTVEQLAGDLLPNATVPQKIATGFNRNHMSNNETGIIDEEYRVEYVFDRVDTTMTTWLGLTIGCAQCHDHKYDPITQREYYQLFAFFNNVPERGLLTGNNPPPVLSVPSPAQEQRIADLTADAAAAVAAFEPLQTELNAQIHSWESTALDTLPTVPDTTAVLHESFDTAPGSGWRSIGTDIQLVDGVQAQAARFDGTQHAETDLSQFRADDPWSIGLWFRPDGPLSCVLSRIEPQGDRRGLEFLWQKGRLVVNLVSQWGVDAIELDTIEPVPARQWHHLVVSCDGSRQAGGVRVFIDGAACEMNVRRDTLSGTIHTSEPLRIGRRDSGLGCYGQVDNLRVLPATLSAATVSDWFHAEQIGGILAKPPTGRTKSDADVLQAYYVARYADETTRDALARVNQTQQAVREQQAMVPTTLIMQELEEPRLTAILSRGVYDQPGDSVEPDVPTALSPFPDAADRNRLGFAEWLVADNNPLMARVVVNRLWAQCFGDGLVRTMNDFGTQGEPPTHPQLLDWLAATFRDSGWDVKALLKLIVTSQTYQQSSQYIIDESAVFDPDNRLLARGPAFRLPMEMIRDQALAVSGLLVPRIGGPSVRPYQPPGLWEEVSYNGEETYETSKGDGLWRRSLYTFIKRQAPPPVLLLFDGPTREKCTVRRARTNTPMQALVLLNDATYIEASRALATRVLSHSASDKKKLQQLWRRVFTRSPESVEQQMLLSLLQRQRARFADDPDAASRLLAVGEAARDDELDARELASWTIVAHTLLNLDEAIMRR